MKKSTIVKIVLLALVAVFAFTLVACGGGNTDTGSGEKITIYLDPNGGNLGDQADEIQVVVGENIGKLPTPTRGGYKFLGWFEDGNERWEIDRKTKAEYDMEAVALWEPLGELVTVDFKLASDESLVDSALYFQVVKGQKILTAISALPTAQKQDTTEAYYKFLGWKDSKGNDITLGTTVEADLTIIPQWETIRYCLGGVEQHNWGGWTQISEATCTTPARYLNQCLDCLWEQEETRGEAPGHDWSDAILSIANHKLVRARQCRECGRDENDAITPNTAQLFEVPVITGDAWGAAEGAQLINGNFDDKPVDPKTGASITMTLDSKDGPVYVGTIVITGRDGAVSYEVSVTYADGSTAMLGIGSNTVPCEFAVNAEITQIEVYVASSNGGTYFSEIATFAD